MTDDSANVQPQRSRVGVDLPSPAQTALPQSPSIQISHEHRGSIVDVANQAQSSLQPQPQPRPQSQPQSHFQADHSSGSNDFTTWPFNPNNFLTGEAPIPDSAWPMSQHNIVGDPWLLNSNFDLAGIESDIAATMVDWAGLPNHLGLDPAPPAFPESLTHPEGQHWPPAGRSPHVSVETCDSPPCEVQVSGKWFNKLQAHARPSVSRYASEGPEIDSPDDVNESHRQDLSKALQLRTFSGSLPSVDFLNLALELYFERFHPIFPIVHKATFRPERTKALLLLSICSIGSLFIGTEGATAVGTDLFRRLNKVILASWEQHMCRSGAEALCMVQAAILGQTFGLMSGTSNDVFMADSFHGTVLSWVRNVTSPAQWIPIPINQPNSEADCDRLWRRWSLAEQKARLTLGLRIHDAELAAMFHRHPLLRHNDMTPSFSYVNDVMFEAKDAQTWFRLQQEANHPGFVSSAKLSDLAQPEKDTPMIVQKAASSSRLAAYSILQSLNAHILELRSSTCLTEAKNMELTSGLVALSSLVNVGPAGPGFDDGFHSRTLWHLNFMSLSADFDLLERVIGRDGPPSQAALDELRSWATSADSQRCMFHALLLLESVEAIRFGQEPAIHVGRSLFCTGLLWTALARLSHGKLWVRSSLPAPRCIELRGYGDNIERDLSERSGLHLPEPYKKWSRLAYKCSDLLQKLSRWGLSENLAQSLIDSLRSLDGPGTAIARPAGRM
jgi:hypothetical protein